MFHHAKNVWNKRVTHVYTCFNSGLRKIFSRSLIQCIQSNIIPDRKLGIVTLSEKKEAHCIFANVRHNSVGAQQKVLAFTVRQRGRTYPFKHRCCELFV